MVRLRLIFFNLLLIASFLNQAQSQTEAYLSVFEPLVKSTWSDAFTKYKDLIDRIILKEKAFDSTHYVLYHAHNKSFIILHDFLKYVYKFSQVVTEVSNFVFMRFRNLQQVSVDSAIEYIEKYDLYDSSPDGSSRVLSTNLSLFGNRSNICHLECTFDYFLNNRSLNSYAVTQLINQIFDYYGFDKKYTESLLGLSRHLISDTGNLIQIFIPKSVINKVAYLSVAFGYLYKKPIVRECFDESKQFHKDFAAVLEMYKNNPQSIVDLDTLQSRIIFNSYMFDPRTNIQMFRYNTVKPENMKRFEEDIKALSIEIFSTATQYKFNLNDLKKGINK